MLNGFTSPEIFLFLVFAFLAEIVGTLAGFGSSTILVPLTALFIDVKTAIAVVVLFHFFDGRGRGIPGRIDRNRWGDADRLPFDLGTGQSEFSWDFKRHCIFRR